MACAAAATAALSAVPVTPAPAGLAGGTSAAGHHPLPADQFVPPAGDGRFQVLTVLTGLRASQSRRVSDQLTLSLTGEHHREVGNDPCLFRQQRAGRSAAGATAAPMTRP